jgi:hypothetical protein
MKGGNNCSFHLDAAPASCRVYQVLFLFASANIIRYVIRLCCRSSQSRLKKFHVSFSLVCFSIRFDELLFKVIGRFEGRMILQPLQNGNCCGNSLYRREFLGLSIKPIKLLTYERYAPGIFPCRHWTVRRHVHCSPVTFHFRWPLVGEELGTTSTNPSKEFAFSWDASGITEYLSANIAFLQEGLSLSSWWSWVESIFLPSFESTKCRTRRRKSALLSSKRDTRRIPLQNW